MARKTKTSNLGVGLKVRTFQNGKLTKSTPKSRKTSVGGNFGSRKTTIAKQKAEFKSIRKSDALFTSLTKAKTTAARQRIIAANQTAVINRTFSRNPGLRKEVLAGIRFAQNNVTDIRQFGRRITPRMILNSLVLRRFLGQRIF